MTFISLDYWDLAIASLLLVVNGVLSLALNLKLERQLAIAAIRMVVQLALVGLVLTMLFALASPWWTGLMALVMLLFAGREIMARQTRRLLGWWSYGLGTGTIVFAAMLVTILALTTQVRPSPWYDPRYAIPLLGMILGNTMTGISLGLETLTTSAVEQRIAIEAQLVIGRNRWQAMNGVVRRAMQSGLMPLINSMSAMGLVALPGMMTGQILAGVEPREAVKYQILIMMMIAGSTGVGTLLAVMAGAWRITDHRHRLRLDRLKAMK